MSRRAKFLLVTWVGPSVSVLKRAKMSTDKALIKDVVSVSTFCDCEIVSFAYQLIHVNACCLIFNRFCRINMQNNTL